ncbi:hypothetical protein FB451DRAFT_1367926 [Mycena latifolia]|nr:hypothetical protein FB451DRAFT_1367926 [Mycena latifolia]
MLDMPSANPDGLLSPGDGDRCWFPWALPPNYISLIIPTSPAAPRRSPFLPTTFKGLSFFGSRLRMLTFLVFFVLFPFFKLSSAFTLSLPDKFDSGTLVTVQWTRDSRDVFSFGLMQRSLQGNQPVLSVTPVENSNAASSGTTQVAFNTAGQVLLSVISQLSLSSGEIPKQLSAGKQLTVVPSDNGAVEIPGTTAISSSRTTVLPPTTVLTTDKGGTSTTVTQILSIPLSRTSISSLETPTTTGVASITTAAASSTISVTRPAFTPSAPTVSQLSSSVVSPFSLAQTPISSPATAQASPAEFAQRPGMHRSAVIALAVILPLLFLSAVAFCIVRYQRRATRERIDRFNSIWTWTRAQRATISSFGNDVESAMIPGHGSVTFYP